MATNYIKKINGLAIAASEVAPNSALADTLNTMITGAFEIATLDSTTGKPNVTDPSTKIIYLTKASGSSATDPYTEWIYTSSSTWEIIGETSVDLSQYVNNLTSSGSGSYVTNVTKSGKTLTVTKGNLPTASTETAGIVKLGTASGTAAQGNHTHTTTLASDTGTSTVTLAHGSKYKLTAGGTSVIFTMPTDNNTDTKVKATAKTDNANYKILATASASPTSGNATEAVYDADITLNPSTNTIAANISGDAATASAAKSGSSLETAINGKSPTSHTHSVKINGSTKTIAASGGSAVDLGNYVTNVKVNGTSCTTNNVADIPLAAVTSTSGAGAAGAVTLEIVSI